jgi:hypothetical protein
VVSERLWLVLLVYVVGLLEDISVLMYFIEAQNPYKSVLFF